MSSTTAKTLTPSKDQVGFFRALTEAKIAHKYCKTTINDSYFMKWQKRLRPLPERLAIQIIEYTADFQKDAVLKTDQWCNDYKNYLTKYPFKVDAPSFIE